MLPITLVRKYIKSHKYLNKDKDIAYLKQLFKNIKSGSKLIVIYIATLIVSIVILTYLSVNNIANFEELTEKRISEEQKLTADRFSHHFESTLRLLADTIDTKLVKGSLSKQEENLSADKDFIDQILIMKNNGVMVYPYFIPSDFLTSEYQPAERYLINYRRGEENEFIRQNYQEAVKAYGNALPYAKGSVDSAQIYMTLGRLNLKLDDRINAFSYYNILIRKHGLTLNNFGFPYSYIAMDQLLKIKDPQMEEVLNKAKEEFINKLLNNEIPMNNGTAGILNRLRQSLNATSTSQTDSLFNTSIDNLEHLLQGANLYRHLMRLYQDNQLDSIPHIGEFGILQNPDLPERLLLVNNYNSELSGFIINLNAVFEKSRLTINLSDNRFKFELSLTDQNRFDIPLNSTSQLITQFSPFLKGRYLSIKLQNPHIVEEYVFKRTITVIVGLSLLFGAMLLGLYTLIQDVNRKKRMDKLRADFIANVTHELKTPLTSINMFADSIVLKRVNDEKTIAKYANIILKESEKLKRMITNILDFARKESDKLKFNFKKEKLSEVIGEIMEEMNYWLEIHEFEVACQLDEAIYVNIDKEAIKQVLSNLITNAIKYSPNTKKIQVRSYEESDKVFIEVEDHGMGIPADKQEFIFEKFMRVQRNETDSISGTGLGLTVSKDIINAHNGNLSVKSKVGKGSTFIIELNKI